MMRIRLLWLLVVALFFTAVGMTLSLRLAHLPATGPCRIDVAVPQTCEVWTHVNGGPPYTECDVRVCRPDLEVVILACRAAYPPLIPPTWGGPPLWRAPMREVRDEIVPNHNQNQGK
jgi:hypothetical protein